MPPVDDVAVRRGLGRGEVGYALIERTQPWVRKARLIVVFWHLDQAVQRLHRNIPWIGHRIRAVNQGLGVMEDVLHLNVRIEGIAAQIKNLALARVKLSDGEFVARIRIRIPTR